MEPAPQIGRVPSFTQQYKILVLGDSGVGKSSIIARYTRDSFTHNFLPTIGIDMRSKEVDIPARGGAPPRRIRLALWDSAGQERFRAITKSYLRGSHGIAIVYDVTDRHSFENVDLWLATVEEIGFQSVVVLVANKTDMPHPEVTEEEGRAVAMERGVAFFAASAKESRGIDHLFLHLAMQVDEQENKRRTSSISSSSSSAGPMSKGINPAIRPTRNVIDAADGKADAASSGTCCAGLSSTTMKTPAGLPSGDMRGDQRPGTKI